MYIMTIFFYKTNPLGYLRVACHATRQIKTTFCMQSVCMSSFIPCKSLNLQCFFLNTYQQYFLWNFFIFLSSSIIKIFQFKMWSDNSRYLSFLPVFICTTTPLIQALSTVLHHSNIWRLWETIHQQQ